MASQSMSMGNPIPSKGPFTVRGNRSKKTPMKALAKNSGISFPLVSKDVKPFTFGGPLASSRYENNDCKLFGRSTGLRCLGSSTSSSESCLNENNDFSKENLNFIKESLKKGIILAATVCGVLVFGCKRAIAMESVVAVMEQSKLFLRNAWPKVLPVLRIFKEQGLALGILLALSAFFSMAETSITTLWPWKVYILYH